MGKAKKGSADLNKNDTIGTRKSERLKIKPAKPVKGVMHKQRNVRKFNFFPAHLPNKLAQPEPIFDLPIGKHNLTVINAWEIATNDMAASVLDLDDPPLIPADQLNAPVLQTLEWLKSLRGCESA